MNWHPFIAVVSCASGACCVGDFVPLAAWPAHSTEANLDGMAPLHQAYKNSFYSECGFFFSVLAAAALIF